MAHWYSDIPSHLPEATAAFASLEAVWQLQGQYVTASSLCTVVRVELDGRGYYVKRYCRAGDGVANYLGPSKARREWQNLQRFKKWGLPAAQLVACGEEGGWTKSRRGVVITAEVEASEDLASLAKQGSPLLRDPDWVQQVSQQVARATAVMHAHRFAHNDWKWRNILVSGPVEAPQIHMIDCPAGMFWWGPLFEYRRIKDIACLDKVAKRCLSLEQRQYFYRCYRRIDDFSHKDRRDLHKIQHFFDGRD